MPPLALGLQAGLPRGTLRPETRPPAKHPGLARKQGPRTFQPLSVLLWPPCGLSCFPLDVALYPQPGWLGWCRPGGPTGPLEGAHPWSGARVPGAPPQQEDGLHQETSWASASDSARVRGPPQVTRAAPGQDHRAERQGWWEGQPHPTWDGAGHPRTEGTAPTRCFPLALLLTSDRRQEPP